MEENTKEQQLVSEEEFKKQIHEIAENNKAKMIEAFDNQGTLFLQQFNGVGKHKSIRRAIKRGHVSIFGDLFPKKPFNNRKRNKNGDITNQRRKIYAQYKSR